MPTEITITTWSWSEAFSKYGFDDGDSPEAENNTSAVVYTLEQQGCTDIEEGRWGLHNYMIHALTYEGVTYDFDGYSSPRTTLPQKLVDALDAEFADEPWEIVHSNCTRGGLEVMGHALMQITADGDVDDATVAEFTHDFKRVQSAYDAIVAPALERLKVYVNNTVKENTNA